MTSPGAHQLISELPSEGSRTGVVITASKEIEPGARAMLVLAEGLFRLDVVLGGDTLRTVVRNLSDGPLRMSGGVNGPDGSHVLVGEAAAYEPARAGVEFTVGEPGDQVEVGVTLATMRFAGRGTVRISAQAIVRH